MTKAVFFDVDFTLIYPGPTFQAEGYRDFCERYGMQVETGKFAAAVAGASPLLDGAEDSVYDPQLFVDYTAHIIRGMGGSGPAVEACAAEMYSEWAACKHFYLYDDVPAALHALAERGVRIGLISNSHRSLDVFQEHFALAGLISVAVSSSEHGYMKPHRSIFDAAMKLAGVSAGESIMVGDSLSQDVEGARRAGMRGVLVCRAESGAPLSDVRVPVVRTLLEIPSLL